MAEFLPFFPDAPDISYGVVLDGVQYLIRLVWRTRTASWYLDLSLADGSPLLRGRRLSPGTTLNEGLALEGPPGWLVADGADPYGRGEVRLLYFSGAEVADARARATTLPDVVVVLGGSS